MLAGSFKHLSAGSKFLLLLLLEFGFLLFSTLLGTLLLVPFWGSHVFEMFANPDISDNSIVNAMKFLQIMNATVGMLLPSLIFAWLCFPEMPAFTGLNKKISLSVVLASVMLTLLAQPFIVQTAEWNSRLLLPDGLSAVENWMRRTEEQASMMTDAFLRTTSTRGLILNIFMIAILPAIAEELLFRGLIARMLHQATRNIHVAVILSAVLFAAIHIQFFSFLPRLLLGMLLGYLFFWSGSLWLPVTMHLTNNLLSVVVEFLYQTKMVGTTSGEFGRIENYYLLACSLLCTGVLMAFIYRKRCLAPDAGRQ